MTRKYAPSSPGPFVDSACNTSLLLRVNMLVLSGIMQRRLIPDTIIPLRLLRHMCISYTHKDAYTIRARTDRLHAWQISGLFARCAAVRHKWLGNVLSWANICVFVIQIMIASSLMKKLTQTVYFCVKNFSIVSKSRSCALKNK